MNECISREALLAEIAADYGNWIVCNDTDESYSQGVKDNYSDTIRLINDIPAADVQPVKHGRWETWGYIFHGIAWKRCSVCGKTADISYQALLDGKIEMATPSICGCCSARMDGGSE